MLGRIFAIEEFSTFDGPGIRMTVFLKGCPLSCPWCHNPEGQSTQIEYYRSPNGCVNCDNCLIENKLTSESISLCKRNLVRAFGEDISSSALTEKILKNAKILSMNAGGVTFSGGEPTLQRDFLLDCLKKLKGKVHTCIQTTGFSENFCDFLDNADMFLYDLKFIDSTLHKTFCKQDNKIILENYKKLASSNKPFITRVALITGVTDTEKNLTDIALFLKENNVKYVELLPYNKLAGAKYKGLMREYDFIPNADASCKDPVKLFKSFDISAKII